MQTTTNRPQPTAFPVAEIAITDSAARKFLGNPFLSFGPIRASPINMQGLGKRFVYVLRSEVDRRRHYVGVTSDVGERLHWHNNGPSGQTLMHRPWVVVLCVEFLDERTAIRFERYSKSGSGRAFTKRHFVPAELS